jgi:hypothetical protein
MDGHDWKGVRSLHGVHLRFLLDSIDTIHGERRGHPPMNTVHLYKGICGSVSPLSRNEEWQIAETSCNKEE